MRANIMVESVIGQGRVSKVYRCLDSDDGCYKALKVSDGKNSQYMANEVEVLTRLHRYGARVPAVFGHWKESNRSFILQEQYNSNLRQLIDRGATMCSQDLESLMLQVA